jgi:hypothetical protein
MGNQRPPLAGMCLAASVLLIGACCLLCMLVPYKGTQPKPKTLSSAELSPDQLRRQRIRFSQQIQPKITETHRELLKMVALWQSIISGLSAGAITRLEAYDALKDLERAARLHSVNWKLPEDLPSDVYNLLTEAETNYRLAFDTIAVAAKATQSYIDSGSLEKASEARRAVSLVSAEIRDAEAKIEKAKKFLGFHKIKINKK